LKSRVTRHAADAADLLSGPVKEQADIQAAARQRRYRQRRREGTLATTFPYMYARVRVMGSYMIWESIGAALRRVVQPSWDPTDDHSYPLPENRTRML
jgi:hypothetical protein